MCQNARKKEKKLIGKNFLKKIKKVLAFYFSIIYNRHCCCEQRN